MIEAYSYKDYWQLLSSEPFGQRDDEDGEDAESRCHQEIRHALVELKDFNVS